MAGFRADVRMLDALILSMKQAASLTTDDKEHILRSAAEVVAKSMRETLKALGLYRSHALHNSIRALWKISENGHFLIYPEGEHHKYNAMLHVRLYKRSKHGRTYAVGGKIKSATADEVGYVLEIGSPKRGIPAFHWMEQANNACIEEVIDKEQNAWQAYLDGIGL